MLVRQRFTMAGLQVKICAQLLRLQQNYIQKHRVNRIEFNREAVKNRCSIGKTSTTTSTEEQSNTKAQPDRNQQRNSV